VPLTSVKSFEELRALLGDVNGLVAMAEDRVGADIATTFTDVTLRNLDACMALGIQPDGLWIYGTWPTTTPPCVRRDVQGHLLAHSNGWPTGRTPME